MSQLCFCSDIWKRVEYSSSAGNYSIRICYVNIRFAFAGSLNRALAKGERAQIFDFSSVQLHRISILLFLKEFIRGFTRNLCTKSLRDCLLQRRRKEQTGMCELMFFFLLLEVQGSISQRVRTSPRRYKKKRWLVLCRDKTRPNSL